MAEAAGVTLEQIVAESKLNPRCLEEKCSQEKIFVLSEQILDPILVMGTTLRLNQRQIRDIDTDYKTEKEKRIALLQEWLQTFAFKATYKTFVEALLSCGKANNAMEVCKMLAEDDRQKVMADTEMKKPTQTIATPVTGNSKKEPPQQVIAPVTGHTAKSEIKTQSLTFVIGQPRKSESEVPIQAAPVTGDSKKISNYTLATNSPGRIVRTHVMKNPEKRTILILGRIGAGKSSLANAILGVNKFEGGDTMNEGVKVLQSNDSSQYTIKVFDIAEGNFINPEMSARKILSALREIHRIAPGGLHLILFVTKHGRWTEEDLEQGALYLCLKYCGRWSKFSALVITGCEMFDGQERRKIIESFGSVSRRAAAVARFMRKGIYTVGFPDVHGAPSSLKAEYERKSAADKEKIRQLIYECEDCLPIQGSWISNPFFSWAYGPCSLQ